MSGTAVLRIACALLLSWLANGALAQDPESLFTIEEEPVSPWLPFAELSLRGDSVTGLPGGRSDLERLRAALRAGAVWSGAGGLRAGAAARMAAGTDGNDDNLRNNDNQRSDEVALDALWLGYQGERWRGHVGKRALGLVLTPLLWDADLRPAGAQVQLDVAAGFDRWSVAGGAWALDHPLDGDARMAALQGGWHWREGARTSASVLLAWIGFDRLQGLAESGLARGNTLQSGRYASDYRLLDLQLALRHLAGQLPLELRLDLVRNLAADQARDAARFSAVLGDRRIPGQWEFGYAVQRIQRDAVLAAANADDWWFHAGARGHMPWVGRGFGEWSLRVALFLERRDGLRERTHRLLVDLERRW